jgi:hypothetical protein
MVGHIRYPDDREGALIYFKPSLIANLPQDVLAYARLAQAFPRQSTIDQFLMKGGWPGPLFRFFMFRAKLQGLRYHRRAIVLLGGAPPSVFEGGLLGSSDAHRIEGGWPTF